MNIALLGENSSLKMIWVGGLMRKLRSMFGYREEAHMEDHHDKWREKPHLPPGARRMSWVES